MKPKKLPRKIQAYLLLMGLFFGQVIGTGALATSWILLEDLGLAFLVWMLVILSIYAMFIAIACKYRKELSDWGLVDKPKKKKIPTLEEMQKK